MNDAGWYRMHRGWMSSDDFKPEPFTEREAFMWSIEKAAFEPHVQWFNGRRIELERGQLVTSLRQMVDEFGWTIKRVRGFIDRMGKCQKWAHETAHTHCIISVLNYDRYQSPDTGEGHTQGQAEGTVRAQSGHSEGTQDKKEQEGIRIRDSADAESFDAPAQPKPTAKADPFPRPDFADPQHWSDFLANRKRKRLANTATAHKRMMDDIARFADDEWPPGRLIEIAAARGWGGIYDPRPKQDHRNGNGTGHRPANLYSDRMRDPVLDDLARGRDPGMARAGFG